MRLRCRVEEGLQWQTRLIHAGSASDCPEDYSYSGRWQTDLRLAAYSWRFFSWPELALLAAFTPIALKLVVDALAPKGVASLAITPVVVVLMYVVGQYLTRICNVSPSIRIRAR